MKEALTHPYRVEEVIFDMHPFKAQGPDGYSTRFFHKLCPTERYLIISTKGLISNLMLILVPKTDPPKKVNDFLSISLFNTMVYKVVSRMDGGMQPPNGSQGIY